MFYYLTVSYDIPDLAMDDFSSLVGPFPTAEARDKALASDLGERDLETSEIVNVTKLWLRDGKLVTEDSFLASDEHQGDPDEEDEDFDDE